MICTKFDWIDPVVVEKFLNWKVYGQMDETTDGRMTKTEVIKKLNESRTGWWETWKFEVKMFASWQ